MTRHSTSRGSRAVHTARVSEARLMESLSCADASICVPQGSSDAYRSLLRTKPASFWVARGEKKALALFHEAARRVPAYKDFLKKQKVRVEHIKTIADFSNVPPTTKENYIKAYPLVARSWDGKMLDHRIFAMSSGTSGEPTLWPRGAYQESEANLTHELLFTELCDVDRFRTLMIIGFPMGIYVSGIATALPAFNVSLSHPHLTIATVGNQKEHVLSLAQTIGDQFQQIVLIGHPFFLKDVIETGLERGIDWTKLRMRMISCSEGFNEVWRSYVTGKVGAPAGASFFNTYGSSEFLLVGYENPYTVRVRGKSESDHALCARLFGGEVTPDLFQYNPLLRYIETDGTDLLITATSGVPLIRFNQHDAGGVLSYESVVGACGRGVGEPDWKLPFVTLYGRSDRTLVFYAANIYPEHVMTALNTKTFVPRFTGKFVMEKKYTARKDQQLIVHIELKKGVAMTAALARAACEQIVRTLVQVNREYADASTHMGKDMTPHVILHAYQDPVWFTPGLKPRFIKQN